MDTRTDGYLSRRYCDASLQESGLRGWSQTYCQLKPGSYEGRLEMLALDGVELARETISVAVHQRTAPPKGRVVFVKPLSTESWRMNASLIEPGSFTMIRNGEEQSVAFSGSSDLLIASVDERLVDDLLPKGASACAAPATEAFNFCSTWMLSLLAHFAAPETSGLSELMVVLPGMIADRLQFVASRLKEDPRVAALERKSDAALVQRAERCLDEEPGEKLTVAGLAAALGVPVDHLRSSFVRAVGIGPGQWLRTRRLDAAQRDLLVAGKTGDTVTAIATRWGFWHFGRFASSYAAHFGEAPSLTARRGGAVSRRSGP